MLCKQSLVVLKMLDKLLVKRLSFSMDAVRDDLNAFKVFLFIASRYRTEYLAYVAQQLSLLLLNLTLIHVDVILSFINRSRLTLFILRLCRRVTFQDSDWHQLLRQGLTFILGRISLS